MSTQGAATVCVTGAGALAALARCRDLAATRNDTILAASTDNGAEVFTWPDGAASKVMSQVGASCGRLPGMSVPLSSVYTPQLRHIQVMTLAWPESGRKEIAMKKTVVLLAVALAGCVSSKPTKRRSSRSVR